MKEKFYEIASVKDIDTFFAKCSYIYGTEIDKYNEGFEYEIKLDFSNEKNINVVNKIVSNLLEQSYNYVINRCEKKTDYTVEFFENKVSRVENSIFIYDGKPMLKEKLHTIILSKDYKVFKSTESFVYDREEIRRAINKDEMTYIGSMRKERCKDFILNVQNGMVFASAVSKCTINSESQYQYEIEYYGHYNIGVVVIEEMVLEELVKIAEILVNKSEVDFQNSEQTKLSFVLSKVRKENIKDGRENVYNIL